MKKFKVIRNAGKELYTFDLFQTCFKKNASGTIFLENQLFWLGLLRVSSHKS